jgi:hypothetical protein
MRSTLNPRSIARKMTPIALSAFLAAGCAKNPGVNVSAPPVRIPASEKLTPANYPKFKSFNTAGEAVAELVQVFDPQIIAFAEPHNEVVEESNNEMGGDFKSPSQRFGEEILPVLKNNRFMDLVLEFAPASPQAALEFDRFHRTGTIDSQSTPTLMSYAAGRDEKGILSIYQNARDMRLYGGNSNPEVDETPEIRINGDGPIVRYRTASAAYSVLIKGGKVTTYNGNDHNDVRPLPKDVKDSFGPYFNRYYRYLAIDLIVPEMIGGYPMSDRSSNLYRPLVPQSGVMLYRRSERDFSIIFAKSA